MTAVAPDIERSIRDLLEAYRAGDEQARDRLVERYMPLVRSLASRYAGRGEPLEDLVQVGSIGLVLAIERFDTERGVQFTTYAVPTIVGEIQRHFRDRAWALHVPRRMKELSLRLTRTIEARRPISAARPRSPSSPRRPGSTRTRSSRRSDLPRVLDAVALAAARPRRGRRGDDAGRARRRGAGLRGGRGRRARRGGLVALDERERPIVELRFFEGLTQSEIAARVGISQMHVSRLLRRALVTMQGASRRASGGGGMSDGAVGGVVGTDTVAPDDAGAAPST